MDHWATKPARLSWLANVGATNSAVSSDDSTNSQPVLRAFGAGTLFKHFASSVQPVARLALLMPCVMVASFNLSHAASEEPSIEQVLSVPQVAEPRIAPDGSAVVYTMERPDWIHNRYYTEIYIARRVQAPEQFTDNPAGSSFAPSWSSDSKWIAYLADDGDGPQIRVAPVSGDASKKLTAIPGGVIAFEWSPDGRRIALVIPEPADAKIVSRSKTYGQFSVMREAAPAANLWILDVPRALANGPAKIGEEVTLRRLTGGPHFSVAVFSVYDLRNNFAFSPDSRKLVFTYAASLNIMDAVRADIAIVDLETGVVKRLVETPDYWEETPIFSPDGQRILYSRLNMKDFLLDNQLMTVSSAGGEPTVLRTRMSHSGRPLGQAMILGWQRNGIHVFSLEGVKQQVFRIDPVSGIAAQVTRKPDAITAADFVPNGREIAVLGFDGTSAPDIYRLSSGGEPQRLSAASDAISRWPHHKVELIHWVASDGIRVEGVLYTPEKLSAPAPLVVVLHGGPRDVARPVRLHNEFFPVEQWLTRGAVVLFPNYRGSIGYGEQFRRLTVLNIGRAETLDVESAIDYLSNKGLIDPRRVGVGGHSWGGYLSAFLATTSDRFKAISVVSGITDNTVNYVLSNAGVGEGGYLQSTPWKNPNRWATASSITYARQAHTPTLIQHGDEDVVVPVANAYILDRALADMGVPVRTVIYATTGHNHFRPKERLAANLQNWQWFEQYLWDNQSPLPWD